MSFAIRKFLYLRINKDTLRSRLHKQGVGPAKQVPKCPWISQCDIMSGRIEGLTSKQYECLATIFVFYRLSFLP